MVNCRNRYSQKRKIIIAPLTQGLREDCERLMYKLVLHPCLDFEQFCKLWRQSHFCYILYGRRSLTQTIEVTEDTLDIIKSYLTRSGASHKERTASLFLLYAVYFTQPVDNCTKIWMTAEDVAYFKLVEREARRQMQEEVLYALGSLLTQGALMLCPSERQYGLDKKTIAGLRLWHHERALLRHHCVLEQCDIALKMREIQRLSACYTECKRRVEGQRADKSLRLVSEDFADDVYKLILKMAAVTDDEPCSA